MMLDDSAAMSHNTRFSFDRDLIALRDDVLRLSQLVDAAISASMNALKEYNVEKARQIIAADEQINILRYHIEEQSYTLMATKQPAARDMRTVMTAVHIAVELERIADYAAGICKLIVRMVQYPALKMPAELNQMTAIARDMMKSSLDAYVTWDITLAHTTKDRDDEVDDLNEQVFTHLLALMSNEPRCIHQATYMLWITHNLERIADRVTNICERVVYMVTGQVRAKLQKAPPRVPPEAP